MTNFDNQFTLRLNEDGTCTAPVQPPWCTELNAKVSIPAITRPTSFVSARYVCQVNNPSWAHRCPSINNCLLPVELNPLCGCIICYRTSWRPLMWKNPRSFAVTCTVYLAQLNLWSSFLVVLSCWRLASSLRVFYFLRVSVLSRTLSHFYLVLSRSRTR